MERTILVDNNIILDVITHDPIWSDWASDTLLQLADEYSLAINPIIYAEISIISK
ncbi:hypothetical protein FACS1894187_25750 [Synergistales bacterium]|nr:hypothetical protein FACS1894187_25750 [Synergistales bacterium]